MPGRRGRHPPPAGELAASAPEFQTTPRLSRQMALAIKLQQLIECGEIEDYADLARLGFVSRARITQIMNLLNLAPDIQEQILFLRGELSSRPRLSERHLRSLSVVIDWSRQRQLWGAFTSQSDAALL